MSAFKRSLISALAVAAAATAAALAASPASAAPQAPRAAAGKPVWTVSPGGVVTAASTGITIRDTTAGQTVPCYLSTMTIRLEGGKKISPNGSTVTSAAFGQCTLPKGLPVVVKLAAFPWDVKLDSYDAATEVTTGTLSGMHLGLSVPLIGCSAVADGPDGQDAHTGAVSATYSNKTHVLKATGYGNLRLYDVEGCQGLIANGDSITLTASYAVAPHQKITSP